MATKHDNLCITKAADDEPLFVIRAQDALAVETINYWISLAGKHGSPKAKREAALADVQAVKAWQDAHPDRVKVPD